MFAAEAGAGAKLNGHPIQTTAIPLVWRGNLVTRLMPDALRNSVVENLSGRFDAAPETGCSAAEYADMIQGGREFTVYYRLLSWDHVAPAFVLTEAGGCVEHLDGKPYTARSVDQVTVVARTPAVAAKVREWLNG
jgi:fructose-1,6-bisphosphatase/inositol monophosphatase family enzyme